MNNAARTQTTRNSSAIKLGERLRQLRVSAGLTQTELAGSRFSKEYVSQIERGKTRPTRETIEWLAQQLGVDPDYLQNGVSTDERGRIETMLARAEALAEAHKCGEALEQIEDARTAVLVTGAPDLEVRMLAVEAWARQDVGEVREALELLARARTLAESQGFSDVDRADVLFRIGVCRYKLSSIATAVALFDEALQLAERSGLPCDRLRAEILLWRSRCYRRHRDYLAARENVERALELSEASRIRPPPPTHSSRPPSSPNGRATSASHASTRSGPGHRTRRSPTAPWSAACSTTSAVSPSCSASPKRPSAT